MDCSYFRERINRYIDGELGYFEVAELQSHLSFCPACAAELSQTGAVRGTLAAWGQAELAPPTGFAERVAAAVEHDAAAAAGSSFGRVIDSSLEWLDDTLGRMPLPGGRTIPVKNVIGWALAASAAIAIELERRKVQRSRELRPS